MSTTSSISIRFAFEQPRTKTATRVVTFDQYDVASMRQHLIKACDWSKRGNKRKVWVSIPGTMPQTIASHVLDNWLTSYEHECDFVAANAI